MKDVKEFMKLVKTRGVTLPPLIICGLIGQATRLSRTLYTMICFCKLCDLFINLWMGVDEIIVTLIYPVQ